MTVEIPVHFRGVDEYRAEWNAMIVGGFFLCIEFILWCAGEVRFALVAVAVGVVPILLAWFGTRYRCTVDPEGVTLTRYALFLPIRRRKLWLDVEPTVYWCWEEGELGVSFSTVDSAKETGPLGPKFCQTSQDAMVEELKSALSQARAATPRRARQVRCPDLDGQTDQLEIQRWNPMGCNLMARSHGVIDIGEMSFPTGSKFYFNTTHGEEQFRDPRREDKLCSVVCSDHMDLPNGLTIQPEARVRFLQGSEQYTVEEGFGEDIQLDNIWADGTTPVSFDLKGRATSYRLASPITIGGVLVPAGSLMSWLHKRVNGTCLHVILSEDVECGDEFYEADRLLSFRPRVAVLGLATRDLDSLVVATQY